VDPTTPRKKRRCVWKASSGHAPETRRAPPISSSETGVPGDGGGGKIRESGKKQRGIAGTSKKGGGGEKNGPCLIAEEGKALELS